MPMGKGLGMSEVAFGASCLLALVAIALLITWAERRGKREE
jgi:hypothetical protein